MNQIIANRQFRIHLKPGLKDRLYTFYLRRRLGFMGQGVTIDARASILRYPQNVQLADDVVIKQGAHICPCRIDASIRIGARTTIGFYSLLYASSKIEIGDDCMIAPFVYIVDSDHGIDKASLMNTQLNQAIPIIVENDVWIGAHAVILKGVQISRGAVIAAGAVVRESVPEYTIVGGVPARIIGERS